MYNRPLLDYDDVLLLQEKVSMHLILEVFRDILDRLKTLDLGLPCYVPDCNEKILADRDNLVLLIVAEDLHHLSCSCILHTGDLITEEIKKCNVAIQAAFYE
jgi:hypothetical protein